MKRTPLYDYHLRHGRMIEFAGYELPVWYSSTSDEHMAVRKDAGVFDVSHMGRVRIRGEQADSFVDSLVPTNSSSQPIGGSFYTVLLTPQGGIIDDLIILKGKDGYLLVVNAANKAKDIEHMSSLSPAHNVTIEDVTDETAMIAVQGPSAHRILQPLAEADLSQVKRFAHLDSTVGGLRATITRTGYTGEDGFEIILWDAGTDDVAVLSVWNRLVEIAKPCGLGARDSLRVESGLPLYGSDIDEATNPIEADLRWIIAANKTGYVGAESIAHLSASAPRRLRRGVILEERIPRHGFEIRNEVGDHIGDVTSGTFSPILKKGIALAYLDLDYSEPGRKVRVDVRGSPSDASVVKPPFYDQKIYGWKRAAQQNI